MCRMEGDLYIHVFTVRSRTGTEILLYTYDVIL
jgi:hypothetical protein